MLQDYLLFLTLGKRELEEVKSSEDSNVIESEMDHSSAFDLALPSKADNSKHSVWCPDEDDSYAKKVLLQSIRHPPQPTRKY
jgi:hypothetical protein